MEMHHVIFKYPELFNGINAITISTLPLEICAGTYCKRNSFGEVEDVADIGLVYDNIFFISNYNHHGGNTLPTNY